MLRLLRAVQRRVRALGALRRAPATTRARLAAGPMRRVLVVCYGNIYRSAFVGEYLRARAGDVEVRSRGFHPKVGRESPAAHVERCAARGIDLSQHRSALATRDDVAWADTIVLMDRHNWQALDALGARPAQLVWLGTLVQGGVEIEDPYGLDEAATLAVMQRMEDAAAKLAGQIRMQGIKGTGNE